MSFTYDRKRIHPKILPCDTPHEIYLFSGSTLPILTTCSLLVRYDSNHCNTVPLSRSGRLPGIAGNAENDGNDGKVHRSHQILNQIFRHINKLCLGKISRQKVVRIKFSVNLAFSNMLYGKKRKPGNAGSQQKAF